LNSGDYDILAALFAAESFMQHALRFADAGGIAQKHFQLSAPLAAFNRLQAAQQLFSVGPALGFSGHSLLFYFRSGTL
jgi:hypothetical protein